MLYVGPGHDAVDDNEETGHHGRHQSSYSDTPEVLRSSHPGERDEAGRDDDHPGTERELEPSCSHQGTKEL